MKLVIGLLIGATMTAVIACGGTETVTVVETVVVTEIKEVKGDTVTVKGDTIIKEVEVVKEVKGDTVEVIKEVEVLKEIMVKGDTITVVATASPSVATAPEGTSGKIVAAVGDVGPRVYEMYQLVYPYSQRNHNLGIYETLMNFDGVDLSAGIAESWVLDTDGITFKIHTDVPYHDSRWGNVTAEDVKFSYERTGADGTKHTGGQIITDVYDAFTVVSSDTIRMDFKKNDVRWANPHRLNGNPVLIQSKKLFDEKGEDVAGLTANGTGPYRVIDHVTDDIIVLEAVEDHWQRNAHVKNIDIIEVPEEATRVAMLRTGESQIIQIGLPSIPEVETVDGARFIVGDALGNTGANIYLPGQLYSKEMDDGTPNDRGSSPIVSSPWVGEPDDAADLASARKVRLAMSMAVDRESVIEVLLGGRGCASYLFTTDSCNPFFQEKWKIPYDVAGAKELLADAGYPDGFDFSLFIPTGMSSTREEIGMAMVPMWEAIGLNVTVEKVAYSARRPTMLDRSISDAWIFGHTDAQTRDGYVGMMDYFTTRRVWNPGYEYDQARVFEDRLAPLVTEAEQDVVIGEWLQWVSDTTPDIPVATFKVPWAVGSEIKSWPLTIHANTWPSELWNIELK